MDTRTPVTIQRLKYRPSPWQIKQTYLYFTLEADATRVRSELHMQYCDLLCSPEYNPEYNPEHSPEHSPELISGSSSEAADARRASLVLDGIDLQLLRVAVDGVVLTDAQYKLDVDSLTLDGLPATCVVSIETQINPENNLALEGLYRSSGNFCTQCEAEGFRKITYYLDRPDVLSIFDVTIDADASSYPVLLSNGNLVSQRSSDAGRHIAHWHDPHPKPCYLFALVAGKLAVTEDNFVTASGRQVLLQIYVQEHNLAFCDYAMGALKRSMLWDEQQYGFEYDLERFMIVAVDDFNMGAMENKGLNIFNSRYVLADIDTATDADFLGVEAVIAHEYFHNWTGNRITCRDWFQLSLKEGLTVFRDQCFSSDMHSATVKRIADVRLLRARQFAEDASPMAHPIRPDSYQEINNFYTLTVYEKGAEVIRMLYTLLGADQWRQGMNLWVSRHDGSASTCDAFIDAMQSVTDTDLTQFRLWYSVAGTPQLRVNELYDQKAKRYSLQISQQTPDTPGQTSKPALHVPIRMGLLDEAGNSLALQAQTVVGAVADATDPSSLILNLTERDQSFEFNDIEAKPVASMLRGFSAPVKLQQSMDDSQLALLVAHDSDSFNRWEALQRLTTRAVIAQLEQVTCNTALEVLNKALGSLLADSSLDTAFKAEALQLPSIDTLAEELVCVDYQKLGAASDAVHKSIALQHEAVLSELVSCSRDSQLELLGDTAMGQRRLANAALNLLSYLTRHPWLELAREQFRTADNMSDKLAALACLCHTRGDLRDKSLEEFYQFACDRKLVLDKWFLVQASSRRANVLDDVRSLFEHKDYDSRNPNRVRALVAGFATNNPVAFHTIDGSGYAFLTDRVLELDSINPQLAAGLVKPLTRWARLADAQQALVREQLERIMRQASLSRDVYELVSKSLQDV